MQWVDQSKPPNKPILVWHQNAPDENAPPNRAMPMPAHRSRRIIIINMDSTKHRMIGMIGTSGGKSAIMTVYKTGKTAFSSQKIMVF